MFGYDRLQQALVAAPTAGPAAEVLAAVEAVIKAFRGTAEPLDDATMMAVRVGAEDGVGTDLVRLPLSRTES
jgi:hypothetical protein